MSFDQNTTHTKVSAYKKPYPYRVIFLDVGSTLVKLNQGWQGVYHQVFQKAGFDLPLGEVESAVAQSWAAAAAQDASARRAPSLDADRAAQREIEESVMERLNIHPQGRDELFWALISAFEDPATYTLYPDVLPTLERLKTAGVRLGIISNWSWHLPELCAALGLAPYFQAIVASARVGAAKPHPHIFQYALSRLEARPEECLHIGDSLSADVDGANGVGMEALWLVRPEDRPLYDERETGLTTLQTAPTIAGLDEILNYLSVSS